MGTDPRIHNRRIKEEREREIPMRVLLLIPFRSFNPRWTFPKFPDEVLSAAAVLEKYGHEVQICDNNVDTRQPKDFISFNPDIIGFSVVTGPQITSAIAQSKEFKKIMPGVKVVWGGVHPSLLPEQTIIEPYIDYVVIGAGEYTFLDLVQYLENGHTRLEEIKGLVYKENGKIFKNEPRSFIENLDELPDPAWHLIDFKKYRGHVVLNASRGCPHRCTFCANTAFYKGYRADLSDEGIVSQIEQLQQRYGVTYIISWGEGFTCNHKRLRECCNLFIRKRLKVEWTCDVKSGLDEEDIALMAKSGCISVVLDVVTGSQRMLDFMQKDTTVEEIEKTFWLLIKHKITPTIGILYGLPTETIEDFKLTQELLERLDNPPYLYMKFVPYPGTPLFDYCVTNGLITPPGKLGSDWVDLVELYTWKVNFSNVPQEMIDEAVDNYGRTYAVRRLKFTLKHRPSYFWTIVRDPLKFFRALRNIIRYKKLMTIK